ncbi:MAG TPA: HAMP domain-containing sensor histidine kinase [Polyangiaceae bacterium]
MESREPSAQHALPLAVNFAWLVRLRFGAVLGQLSVIAAVSFALAIRLPLLQLGGVLLLELVLNAWALWRLRQSREQARPITPWDVTFGVGADLILFSLLLYFSGGPANPFSFLYLIHIALAAVVLPPRTSFALVACALGCSLGLFWVHVPLPHDHGRHEHEYSWHMRGMWVAFGLAATFIVYFIQRVLRELRAIEEQLATSRERATRGDAVAALAMLSAGAAHELASPLSTIALASGELLRRLPVGPDAAAARDDVLLIKSQVERCRAILDQLASEAGQAKGSGFGTLGWRAILERGLAGFDRSRLELATPEADEPLLTGSLSAIAQALRNLVSNALDASGPDGAVQLGVDARPGELSFTVRDAGSGMTAAVLARATEPFFTTKPRGQGMGLGLFLAQSVAEQMGGQLELTSEAGRGTRARLVFPLPATKGRMGAMPPLTQTGDAHG